MEGLFCASAKSCVSSSQGCPCCSSVPRSLQTARVALLGSCLCGREAGGRWEGRIPHWLTPGHSLLREPGDMVSPYPAKYHLSLPAPSDGHASPEDTLGTCELNQKSRRSLSAWTCTWAAVSCTVQGQDSFGVKGAVLRPLHTRRWLLPVVSASPRSSGGHRLSLAEETLEPGEGCSLAPTEHVPDLQPHVRVTVPAAQACLPPTPSL